MINKNVNIIKVINIYWLLSSLNFLKRHKIMKNDNNRNNALPSL